MFIAPATDFGTRSVGAPVSDGDIAPNGATDIRRDGDLKISCSSGAKQVSCLGFVLGFVRVVSCEFVDRSSGKGQSINQQPK